MCKLVGELAPELQCKAAADFWSAIAPLEKIVCLLRGQTAGTCRETEMQPQKRCLTIRVAYGLLLACFGGLAQLVTSLVA